MADIAKFIEDIKALNVMELAELVKAIEEEFGVSAAAPVAVAAGGADTAAVAEEKTEFNVVLKSFGAQKLQVVKVVKEITGAALTEAKALVEAAPSTIKEALSKEDAEELKAKLEAVGAEVELQ